MRGQGRPGSSILGETITLAAAANAQHTLLNWADLPDGGSVNLICRGAAQTSAIVPRIVAIKVATLTQ